jgi:phospholipid-binding lipoprotein MlaA
VSVGRAATLLLGVALLAGGCASAPPAVGATGASGAAPGAAAPAPRNPADPWEPFNRRVSAFNDAVDDAVLRPLATAYRDYVPGPVRQGMGNLFGNFGDVWSTANHLLQGKLHSGLDMGMRVLTNTLFGLGGLLDPATEAGLERRSEDFGQTLGRWGVGPGPYVVLPLLGPRTVRDSFGFVVDRQFDGSRLFDGEAASYTYTALELVYTRSELLATTSLLEQAALDRYTFVRDAYLARRLDQVYDGAPPLEIFDDAEAAPAAKPPATPGAGRPPAPVVR